jgi:tetratricopeptide (TPR) repeat protein
MRTRLVLAAFLAFGALGGVTTVGAAADTVSADVLQAESLSGAGKYDQALIILNKYLTTHPTDARALVDRGDIYQEQSKLPESIADYTAALAVNPEYAYAYASRADSYNQMSDFTHALSDANKAVSLKPNYAYALRVRGITRINTDDVAGAQADFHTAVALDPSASSFALACRADLAAKQLGVAQKECAEALQLGPTYCQALFENGRLQLAVADWSGAEATFTKIIVQENGDSGSSYWRAEARYNMHRNDEALSDINIYLLKNPDDGDAYYLRAQIDQSRGDLTAAKKDAASALAHYGIDNDTENMKRAQALLDQLNAARP